MAKPGYITEQAAELLNSQIAPFIGEEDLLKADLSNFADTGKAFDDLPDTQKDIVTNGMIALITEQIFIEDKYIGERIDMMKSYGMTEGNGGIIQINYIDHVNAVDDPSYNPEAYSTNDNFQNIPQEFRTVYFSNDNAEMFELSVPHNWYRGMLKSQREFNSLISMLKANIAKSIALHLAQVEREVFNARAAIALAHGAPHQARNILKEFNDQVRPENPMRVKDIMTDQEFWRFFSLAEEESVAMLTDYNTLGNLAGRATATERERVRVIMNSGADSSMKKYLLADVRNFTFLELPKYRTLYKWQATGKLADFETLTSIDVEVNVPGQGVKHVKQSGILAVNYNENAVGIYGVRAYTLTQQDAKGDKYNAYTHLKFGTMVNQLEDMTVLYVDDSYLDEPEVVAAKTAAKKTAAKK